MTARAMTAWSARPGIVDVEVEQQHVHPRPAQEAEQRLLGAPVDQRQDAIALTAASDLFRKFR